MLPMTAVEERALRADAQRNLVRILDAAREVFAEQGLDATAGDVAARAGVGTATVFRRFPTKDDLIAAVVEQRVREIGESARAAAASDDPDAVRKFLHAAASAYIHDRGFCEAAGTDFVGKERLGPLFDEVHATVSEMLERAQAAGHIRADLTPQDIPVLLSAVAQTGLLLGPTGGERWRRYLDIVLDGLRPQGATHLSRRAPTQAELERAKRSYSR
jgi:AcrR family transcriptional regulator